MRLTEKKKKKKTSTRSPPDQSHVAERVSGDSYFFKDVSKCIKMNSSTWYEGKWQVSEAAWVVHWGGTWQTENLQLQWHSLAAQVIADISNVWSAKPAKCQRTCKSTDYLQEKPKCLSSVALPTPNNQNILIVQLNERVDVVHFFNKIKSWHNYNNAFFLLQLYIIVLYKFTEFRNLLKSDMQNVSKQDCTLWTKTEISFQFFLSQFFLFFFRFVFVVFITQQFS